ncbi:LPS translocon maturation chaperone LptM [Rhizobium halophytocola]|uniref:Small lipoprotein YifL n=1 Tax=Rhizobium halophytocola TaxID=735519 RepID=A0ABS4E2L2_9HYPH|nr:lipoprotein [Rhizobium halophytocola]MBP1852168.1 putative small lipoprotein YifL [Rhizobium halophytocola]
MNTFVRMLAVTLAVGTLVAGCGRKGDLDPPNMPTDQQNKLSTKEQKVPDRPFVLDPLL